MNRHVTTDLFVRRSLRAIQISFFIFCCCACRQDNSADVSIRWKEHKAIALILAKQGKENQESFAVHLSGKSESMLGQFLQEGDQLVFEPVVPLTRGLTYEVTKNNLHYATIEVPAADSRPPTIAGIYPSADTLPENLLKFFFEFSEPMQEDKSLDYIFLLNEKGDTLKNTFLELKPELWNTDGTLLTLWLDPGRIKRDLAPNREMGAPILKGSRYTLHVGAAWKSKEGVALAESFSKTFLVGDRDEKVPLTERWKITAPKKDTKQVLVIELNEALDYALLNETILVFYNEEPIICFFRLSDHERTLSLEPVYEWAAGEYIIRVESRLEDLAGNNLNRPFDRDLSKESKTSEKESYNVTFRVE